jgi:bifunctional DNA-binding transcriptional regulator/antitoxin component of YhaV-PrlF toxin-antitoxin module
VSSSETAKRGRHRNGLGHLLGHRDPGALSPLRLAEQFDLVVETPGRVALPLEVRVELGLEPGDLFSIVTNPASLQLESYREFLMDNLEAVSPQNDGFYTRDFFRRAYTVLEADGAIELPGELVPRFPAGERVVLEVVTLGSSHEVYLYRAED